jgi:hypothetical protein
VWKTYTFLVHNLTRSPSLTHRPGCSPFTILHFKNSVLTSAHSLPINLDAAINSEDEGEAKTVACCHFWRSGNFSVTEVG